LYLLGTITVFFSPPIDTCLDVLERYSLMGTSRGKHSSYGMLVLWFVGQKVNFPLFNDTRCPAFVSLDISGLWVPSALNVCTMGRILHFPDYPVRSIYWMAAHKITSGVSKNRKLLALMSGLATFKLLL
jgi:hypothetical protein